jgi:hypothetical protein
MKKVPVLAFGITVVGDAVTQGNPEGDLDKLPLAIAKCDSEQKLFDVILDERGKEGVVWCSQARPAGFALAQ